jgi:hypothetical protein
MEYREHYGPYRGYWHATSGQDSIWYAEYCGWPAVRQFLVTEDGTAAVAPFDLAFLDRRTPDEAPALPDGHADLIDRAVFEEEWARWAQPRLNQWAQNKIDGASATHDLHYFLIPCPAALKINELGSLLYYEYADLFRRHFEVWEDGTVAVAPYSLGIPDGGAEEMLYMARAGMHLDGTPLGPQEQVLGISHANFERDWERLALPYLLAQASEIKIAKDQDSEKDDET